MSYIKTITLILSIYQFGFSQTEKSVRLTASIQPIPIFLSIYSGALSIISSSQYSEINFPFSFYNGKKGDFFFDIYGIEKMYQYGGFYNRYLKGNGKGFYYGIGAMHRYIDISWEESLFGTLILFGLFKIDYLPISLFSVETNVGWRWIIRNRITIAMHLGAGYLLGAYVHNKEFEKIEIQDKKLIYNLGLDFGFIVF